SPHACSRSESSSPSDLALLCPLTIRSTMPRRRYVYFVTRKSAYRQPKIEQVRGLVPYPPAGRTRPGRHRPGACPRNICEHLRTSAHKPASSSACSMRTKDLVGPPWARQSLAAVPRGLAPRSPSRAFARGSHHRRLASGGLASQILDRLRL